MPNYIDGRLQDRPHNGLEDLDSIVSILGTTRTTFFPLLEGEGVNLESYRNESENLVPTEILGEGFQPVRHAGGIHSYFFQRAADAHLAGNDAANYSQFGGTDAAFSVGAWVLPTLTGTQQTILSKYDVAGTLREYQFYLDASENFILELFDESITDANAAVLATSGSTLTVQTWAFVVIVYNGEGGAPGSSGTTFAAYLNGVDDVAVVSGTGSDGYVDMEDTATPFMIGAADDTAAPTFEFEGRIALPFVCGQALSVQDVAQLYGLGRRLLGLA